MKAMANAAMCVLMLGLAWVPVSPADEIQTDWSQGPGLAGPVTGWDAHFAEATGVSWLAAPGSLALGGDPLPAAVATPLATGFDGAFGIATGDLDGDGDLDLLAAAEYLGDLVAWYSNGAAPPTYTSQVIDGNYPSVSGVAVADLDGDGDLDLVATTGAIGSRMTCYLNDGSPVPAWTPVNLETNWSESWEVATGDVDGDGHVDVIGTNLGFGDVVWWRNDGASPPGWTRQVVDAEFGGAHSARAGDIDGDGRTDIIATGSTTNHVAWWQNGGGDPIAWTKRTVATGFFGGKSVRLGDIDGDGDLDAAACNFDARVWWWANQGGSPVTWTGQLITAAVGQAHQLQLADLSGDGRLDVLVAGYGTNSVDWFQNGGGVQPITWTRRNVASLFGRPLAVAAADLDRDGALEVLATANATDLFRWFEVSAFVAAGELTGALLDTGAGGPFSLDWQATVPAGTEVLLSVRAGDDPGSLGPWSPPVSVPGTVVDPGGRYVQYRAQLTTADAAVSPLLHEVALRRSLAAVLPPATPARLAVHPNPANPRAVVSFELPDAGSVSLEIIDLRGALVRRLVHGHREAGRHEVAWSGNDEAGRPVASGSYLARLATAGGVARTRLSLVR